MTGIVKNWNGHVFGTNTGNVAVTLDGEDAALNGVIRLSDDKHGVAVYEVAGQFVDGSLELAGTPQVAAEAEDLELGNLTVKGSLTSDGRIDGNWTTTIGTGGTFKLWPHMTEVPAASGALVPEQLNTATRSVGTVRLYADDIRNLVNEISRDFTQNRVVITYPDKGSQKNIYSDQFEAALQNLPEIRYLKLSIQEPELYGINRMAMIELSAWGENMITVQSVQESWAIGKAEALSKYVGSFERKIATQYRKRGLTMNAFLALLGLAALPGLPSFTQRLLFVGAGFGILSALAYFHREFVPNFVLDPAKAKPTGVGRLGPGILSWSSTIVGGVIAAVVYGFRNGELNDSPVLDYIKGLIN